MSKEKLEISSFAALKGFLSGRACSDMLFNLVNTAFEHPSDPIERAAMPLAGGIMQHGYQCGMLWGSTLAAGAQSWRLFGPGAKAQSMAIAAAQKLVESFREMKDHINCLEITDLDKDSSAWRMLMFFVIKGGTIGCSRMAASFAPRAFDVMNSVFAEAGAEVPPSPPVSCAALLAQKLGASEERQTIASGLAGGIGLCGGACGALGAAIWLHTLDMIEKGGKVDFKNPKAVEIIERFLEASQYDFTCEEIVGRKFDGVADHAKHLHRGGCKALIDALAGV